MDSVTGHILHQSRIRGASMPVQMVACDNWVAKAQHSTADMFLICCVCFGSGGKCYIKIWVWVAFGVLFWISLEQTMQNHVGIMSKSQVWTRSLPNLIHFVNLRLPRPFYPRLGVS